MQNIITDRVVFLGVDELETLDAPMIDPGFFNCLPDTFGEFNHTICDWDPNGLDHFFKFAA
uniref:Uncharacterized protein n=1 Tax=Streptomyces sp. NBC_00003 TaxID=2903608 RepID=A0AAU2UWL1_9ACTN